MDAAGFVVSIAFTLVKSRDAAGKKRAARFCSSMSHGRVAVWSSALNDKLTGSAYTRHIG
jgi:hypothetical protein